MVVDNTAKEEINLGQAPTDTKDIDLNAPPIIPTSAETAGRRSSNWTWAGITDKNQADLNKDLRNGRENEFRKDAALNNNIQKIKAVTTNPPKDVNKLMQAYMPTNPDWFPESAVAQKWMLNLPESQEKFGPTEWAQFTKQSPEVEAYLRRKGEDYASKLEIFRTEFENVNDQLKVKSTMSKAFSLGQDILFPWFNNLREAGVPVGVASALNNMQAEFLGLPNDALRQALKEMRESMPPEQYAHAMMFLMDHHSAADTYMRDALDVADVATAPLAITGVRAVGSMIRGLERLGTRAPGIASSIAVGDLKSAAEEGAAKQILENISQPTAISEAADVKSFEKAFGDRLFEGFDRRRGDFGANPEHQLESRYLETSRKFSTELRSILERFRNVSRVDLQTAVKMYLNGLDEIMDVEGWFKGPSNMLLERGLPQLLNIANAVFVPYRFGTTEGKLFKSEVEAYAAAEHMGYDYVGVFPKKYDLPPTKQEIAAASWEGRAIARQQGVGYFFEIRRPFKETDNMFRDTLSLGEDNVYPEGLASHFFDYFRNPDEYLAKMDRWNRKTAGSAGNALMNLVDQRAKDIKALGWTKKSVKDLESFLDETQRYDNPLSTDLDKPGWFPETQNQFDEKWQDKFGRLPTPKEYAAYQAVKDLYEADYILRNINLVTKAHRIGVEQVSVVVGKKQLPFVNAIKKTVLPNNDDSVLLATGINMSGLVVRAANKIPKSLKEALKRGELECWQIHAPHLYPLAGTGPVGTEQEVKWILNKASHTKMIDPIQLEHRGGIHIVDEYPYHVVQADMRKNSVSGKMSYVGDTKVFPVARRALADKWIKIANQAIKAREVGDRALEETLVPQLGKSIDWWDKQFKPTVGRTGKTIPPRLRVGQEFHVLESNKRLIETPAGQALKEKYGNDFVDSFKEGNPYLQSITEFSQERNVMNWEELKDYGSASNPVFDFKPAKFMSPLASLSRGLNRIIRSTSFDSLKMASVERWLSNGIRDKIFDMDPRRIYSAPYAFFSDPQYVRTLSPEKAAQYKWIRNAIQSYHGIYSDAQRWTSSWVQSAYDKIYNLSPRVDRVLSEWELGGTRDPLRFMRNIAFHKSLGLFNPGMFLLHFSATYNGALMAGWKPTQAAAAAMMHSLWNRFNDSAEIIAHMDKKLAAWGWKPGWYTESREGLVRSGFGHEMGQFALDPSEVGNELFPTMKAKILNAGLLPFKKGLEGMRHMSWHMAYFEKRSQLPLSYKMTERDWSEVTERADMFSHNMTKASSSAFNQNAVAATATQFTTYFQRLAELTLGKRLTRSEKAWLIGGNMIMYGVPTGAGVAGFPFGDEMKKEAIRLGFNVGDNPAVDFFNHGLPAMMMQYITGQGYDIAERYGPGGMNKYWSDLQKDPNIWKLAFGAVGTTFTSAIHAFSPFMYAVMSTLPGSTDENRWPLTTEDYLGALEEITSLHSAYSVYAGIKYGIFLTKSGRLVESTVTPGASIMMGLTGLKPLTRNEMYLKQSIIVDDEKYQKDILNMMLEHHNKFSRALEQGNFDEADAEMKKLEALYPSANEETIHQAHSLGARDGIDQILQVDQKYFDPRRKPIGSK